MEPNAILAINSLDRYTIGSQPIIIPNPPYPDIVISNPALGGTALISQYLAKGQQCNNFSIQSPGALIYGYIKKIQVSQTQLQYNIPTVVPGKNDYFELGTEGSDLDFYLITIPFGYYTPEELAAVLQIRIIQSEPTLFAAFTVTYNALTGFTFNTNVDGLLIYFVSPAIVVDFVTSAETALKLRTYRLLGMDISNSNTGTYDAFEKQVSANTPNFLYTPYIDICSQTLTKYQKIKDTDSSPSKLTSIISRIYLSGTGQPQVASGDLNVFPLGSRPFTVTQDCNTPKVIRWSRDEAVNSLDFQLYDQYGDLIFQQGRGTNENEDPQDVYYTEFQMTLMCIEGERG
jgi:hypothetical protein